MRMCGLDTTSATSQCKRSGRRSPSLARYGELVVVIGMEIEHVDPVTAGDKARHDDVIACERKT